MKKARNAKSRPVRDFLRLARADDLLSRAGTVMMRSSPKATIWTAGIASSGYLSNWLGLPGLNWIQAITAPLVVGGGLLGAGAGMKYIPKILSGRLTNVAEANDLNLMEDYRKSQAAEHLAVLWDKVFWYESDLRYTDSERRAEREQISEDMAYVKDQIENWDKNILQRLGVESDSDINDLAMAVMAERPLSLELEKSKEGFIISSLYALRHALPQSTEAHQIGFRLNLYEDLCDGAYFDRNDVKLFEQYLANVTIADIRRQVHFGRLDGLKQLPRRTSGMFWHFLVTRKIATGVGRVVQCLNAKYQTDIFNSQSLLWPGEEDAAWLQSFPDAREDVLALRKSIIKGVLGRDWDNAVEVLDRIFLPCFEFATDLRARFDPEYCDGSLNRFDEDTKSQICNSLTDDLQSHGYCRKETKNARASAEKIAREVSVLLECLKTTKYSWLLDDRAALRAVKIAFHTDKGGMKKALLSRRPAADGSLIDQQIEDAIAHKGVYTDRLVSLRLHHQLTILQLTGYKDLAMKLAYEA